MQMSTLLATTLSAWSMAVAYENIEAATGMEIRVILYVAIATMAVGLYLSCRDRKETTEEES